MVKLNALVVIVSLAIFMLHTHAMTSPGSSAKLDKEYDVNRSGGGGTGERECHDKCRSECIKTRNLSGLYGCVSKCQDSKTVTC
ncbi:hypothetical protein CASFOL_031477 [Castilleja foliolosa]|uniref:Uncharacterized protein n=1 Tax=Castilleja foliolosa TaxID=1961234 RepID=A0ABD3C5D7_9LAMI